MDEPVHVVADGAGTPAVLVCPGLGDAWFAWDAVAALLAPRHLVVRFDRPGLGDSPARLTVPTLRGEADRIAGLVSAFDLGRPVVVAHSAAALYAEAYARLVPDGPSALVLVDPTVDPPPPRPPGDVPWWPVRVAGRVGPTLGPAAWWLAVRRMSSRPPAPVLRADARRVYGRGSVAAAAALEWLAYNRMTHDLAQLRAVTDPPAVPVVVLTALAGAGSARGRARWRAAHAELAASFPDGRQEVVRDSRHLMQLDDPAAVAAAVTSVSVPAAQ